VNKLKRTSSLDDFGVNTPNPNIIKKENAVR